MNAENKSASLVSQLKFSERSQIPQGYYRSKLFIASSPTNPLLAAAGPIFSLVERLNSSQTLPDIDEVISNIEHEVNSFQSRLIAHKYSDELIMVSRYLISATIDELIGKSYIRVNHKPAEFKAFIQYDDEDIGPQTRFFQIISYIKERPNQYLDLVELAYYCLITGFEGQYHSKTNGRQELDNTIEELYQLIQDNRVNKPLRLFHFNRSEMAHTKKNYNLLFIGLIAVGLASGSYFLSHKILDQKAKKIFNGHPRLAKLDK